MSTNFTLDLNSLIGSKGLIAPAVNGNLAITESLSFETNYTTGTTPTFAVSSIASMTCDTSLLTDV